MKMRSLAWVALCAAPFLAAQPDTGLAADPLRLTGNQMDTVSAGGAKVASVVATGKFRLKISSDRDKKKIVVEILDRKGRVKTTRTIDVVKGNWSKKFTIDGYKVDVSRRNSKLSIDVNGDNGKIRIASRYDLKSSNITSSSVINSSNSKISSSSTNIITSSSSNDADAKKIINSVLGGIKLPTGLGF